jgi:hypothetical protein
MTGLELAAALERMLEQRPDVSRSKISLLLRGRRGGFQEIRAIKQVKPETIRKAMALIANPPAEALLIPMDQRKRPGPRPGDCRAAAVRRSMTTRAMNRIAKGLSAESARSAALRFAQREIEARQRDDARLTDPVEMALLTLRKTRVVYRASVKGGSHDRFYIAGKGRETINENELIELARKVAR